MKTLKKQRVRLAKCKFWSSTKESSGIRPEKRNITSGLNKEVHSRNREDWNTMH